MARNKESKKENDLNDKEMNEEVVNGEATSEGKDDLLVAEQRYNELNDKYVRIHAEFDNYKKRTNKEKIDIISTANAGLMGDLLTVLDDFERAKANNDEAQDIESVKEGFGLIYNKFKSILDGKGLKVMDSNGEVFDSELYEAIANVPAPSDDLKGKVIDTVEKGYSLNDKVIRYAKVVVGQ